MKLSKSEGLNHLRSADLKNNTGFALLDCGSHRKGLPGRVPHVINPRDLHQSSSLSGGGHVNRVVEFVRLTVQKTIRIWRLRQFRAKTHFEIVVSRLIA